MRIANRIWVTGPLVAIATAGTGFAQSEKEGRKPTSDHDLVSVIWPGKDRTLAVRIAENGRYVCALPGKAPVGEGAVSLLDESGTRRSAKVIHMAPSHGLCLLQGEPATPGTHFPLSDRADYVPGMALTSLLPRASFRIRITGKDREFRGKELPSPLLRVLVESESHCEPGAPLINENGELEGILTGRRLSVPTEVHAIPAQMIRKYIRDIENHARSAPAWIGLLFHSGTPTPRVVEVRKDSPAERAGIVPGDIVIEAAGRRIDSLSDLVECLKLLPANEKTGFKLLREMDVLETVVVPELAP